MSATPEPTKRGTTFHPQPTPLYAAFSNPQYGDDFAEAGIIIGWERAAHEEGDRSWTITMPVIVPFDASGPVLEGDVFWGYIGADIVVYQTIEEAKAAVPKLKER